MTENITRQPLLRSYLYVTATKPELLEKALAGESDAVIVDLEDGVAVNRKHEARDNLAQHLSGVCCKPVFVRMNPLHSQFAQADLETLTQLRLTGIRIPKVHTANEVSQACSELRRLGFQGSLQLQIESAVGVLNMNGIARADPMVGVMGIGEEDLRADLRCERLVLKPLLLSLVVASRAANLLPPVMSVYPRLTDPEGFRESTRWGKETGFFGRITVHPDQVPIINEILTPTPQELDYAHHVISILDESLANGQVTARDRLGNYISIWTKRQAENLLDLADQINIPN